MQICLTQQQTDMVAQAPLRAFVHDLRNLFAVVASAEYLLQRPLSGPNKVRVIEALDHVAREGTALTNAILCGGFNGETPKVNATTELRRLLPVFEALAGTQLEIDLQTTERPVWIRMAKSELEAIMIELVTNAKKAGAKRISIRANLHNGQFWLVAADNGCGFDQSKVARRSEHSPGDRLHGTGLPRIRNSIEAANGHLRIRSKLGRGTVAMVALPAAT